MLDFNSESIFKLTRTTSKSVDKNIEPILVQGERIIESYKTARDLVVFTNKRVIAVNIQGTMGKKKDYTSLPYSKVQAFSVETTGVLDVDSELELYFSGLGLVKFGFLGSNNIVAIAKILGEYIL